MKCELCAHLTPESRLCPPCREMIERLQRIWPQLNVDARDQLQFAALNAPKHAPKAKAASGG